MKNKMKKISIINTTILSVIFIILSVMLFKLNILPDKILMIVIGISFLIITFLVYKTINTKQKKKIFFNVVTLFSSLVMLFILSYINVTYDFVRNMISNNYEYKIYYVITNKENEYVTIDDLENKQLGYLENDSYYNSISKKIDNDINCTYKNYNDVSIFINSIIDNNIDGIIIEKSYYELLQEEYDDFKSNTRKIATYKIKIKKEKQIVKKELKDPFIIYISGIDTYGSISSVSRSDVNMLAVVNPNESKILLVFIPRDYYIVLSNVGYKDKLTHAGIYGIDMSINSIEDLLDIDINYYLRLNFSTLTKSIDLLDGVDIYSDKAFIPWTNKNVYINEGINHMDGKTALAFARERHTYNTGDRHRGENQQAIITAMINKVTRLKYLTRYKDILNSLDQTFETNMTYEEITNQFKMQLSNRKNWTTESISLDGTGKMASTYSMGSRKLYVMEPDLNTIATAKEKIANLTK